MNADQEKQWRISLLTNDEHMAFEWFRQGYTARWTAETMFLDRKTAKRMFASIYRKLCVADEAEVSRVYRTVKLKLDELPRERDTT
jgi:DNA-binding NarL/FixJ family response regulator